MDRSIRQLRLPVRVTLRPSVLRARQKCNKEVRQHLTGRQRVVWRILDILEYAVFVLVVLLLIGGLVLAWFAWANRDLSWMPGFSDTENTATTTSTIVIPDNTDNQ